MTNLIKWLRQGEQKAYYTTIDDVIHDKRCLDAADLLEECERALAAARSCPIISERDPEPAWACGETEEAVKLIDATLARLRGGTDV